MENVDRRRRGGGLEIGLRAFSSTTDIASIAHMHDMYSLRPLADERREWARESLVTFPSRASSAFEWQWNAVKEKLSLQMKCKFFHPENDFINLSYDRRESFLSFNLHLPRAVFWRKWRWTALDRSPRLSPKKTWMGEKKRKSREKKTRNLRKLSAKTGLTAAHSKMSSTLSLGVDKKAKRKKRPN